MAAVVPFIETQQWSFPDYGPQGLSGLGDSAKAQLTAEQMVAASNIEQTRLLYTRTLLQQELAKRTFRLVRRGGNIKIELSEAFNKDTIPWARSSSNIRTLSLFSTNSKMRCPTFDLPAGAEKVGGTCPAAGPAQTTSLAGEKPSSGIVDSSRSLPVLRYDPSIPYRLHEAVCLYCYATGGKYGEPTVQIAELVKYAVVQAALSSPELREAFIRAVVWQIPNLPYDRWLVGKITKRDASGNDDDSDEVAEDAEATVTREDVESPEAILERMGRFGRNVVRIHSAGDFFSPEYAEMWLEIANRLHDQYGRQYTLWAPTRTHVLTGRFQKFWRDAAAEHRIPPNFVIRPSAYHLGDPAPEVFALSGGTSVLTPSDAAVSKGTKFDHQCGVYDLARGNKTCVDAIGPDNQKGCRACWVRPDLRINYVAH